jgi:hypothetical protein
VWRRIRTITVDLNPYLKSELVFEEIDHIKTHQESVRQKFGAHAEKAIFRKRFDLHVSRTKALKPTPQNTSGLSPKSLIRGARNRDGSRTVLI